MLKILARPFRHVTSPVVLWSCVKFSVVFNPLPMVSVRYSQLFSAAPYFFSTSSVGLISGIPPLIGTLIGTMLSGPLSDWTAKYLANRNHGVYEPEFRLVPMIGYLIFCGIGLFGWGLQQSSSWIVPSVFIVIMHVGVSAGTIGCIGYITDCTRENSGDAIALLVLCKSVTGFGIFFFVNDWLAAKGTRQFMISLGSLTVASALLAVPAYILGKRARYWHSRMKNQAKGLVA